MSRASESSTARALLVLALISLFAAGAVLVVVRILLPAPAPALVVARPPVEPPLTRHLLLVIVDGLRYDVATDAARMPRFAESMRRETSAEMWAGRVTMTTSAVMSYGTGQRGQLEQVVRNASPRPPPFDTWLSHARRAGLRIATVGDPAWVEMFGAHIDEHRRDPEGVAIDVDFNPQTFRDTRELRGRDPAFLVAHFVTPDHQAHAYTVPSARYAAHIRQFDRELDELLKEFGPEWTVIVTSDHGALDSGTHGSDVAVARRVPIYAYGPGISRGIRLDTALDQADLAGTMAALLGVSAPAHGRGHVLVEWLDLAPERRARLACADAERALAHGTTLLTRSEMEPIHATAAACRQRAAPDQRISAARASVQRIDALLETRTGLASRESWIALVGLGLLGLGIGIVVVGPRTFGALPVVALLAVLALALTYGVERISGGWPNIVRTALFAACNLGVLGLLLAPHRAARFLETRPVLGAVLIPGVLLASYTSNTQPESYVAIVVGLLLFTTVGSVTPSPARRNGPLLGWVELGVAVVACALLFAAGTRQADVYPAWIRQDTRVAVVTGFAFLLAWAVRRALLEQRSRASWFEALGFVAIVGVTLIVRRDAPAWLGRTAIAAFGMLALILAMSGRRSLALYLGVTSYVWVAREFELLTLVPTLIVADSAGRALARDAKQRDAGESSAHESSGLAQRLILASFVFGLIFVQRIGISGALDFGSLDWGAAAFHDPHVPAPLVGAALVYKYLLAELLVIGSIVPALRAAERPALLSTLVVAYLARSVFLLLVLFVCGKSYWTALRTLGDLPFALIAAVACALAWLAAAERARTARAMNPKPSPDVKEGALDASVSSSG